MERWGVVQTVRAGVRRGWARAGAWASGAWGGDLARGEGHRERETYDVLVRCGVALVVKDRLLQRVKSKTAVAADPTSPPRHPGLNVLVLHRPAVVDDENGVRSWRRCRAMYPVVGAGNPLKVTGRNPMVRRTPIEPDGPGCSPVVCVPIVSKVAFWPP